MQQQLLFNVLFFFMMPAFWFGIGRTLVDHHLRVKRERSLYDSAINPKHTELRTFLWGTIGLGIVGSVLSFAFGIEVSYAWIFAYEAIVALMLVIPGAMFPFAGMGILMLLILLLGNNFYTHILNGNLSLTLQNTMPVGMNFLELLTVMLILQYLFLKFNRKSVNSPVLSKNIRGNQVASYLFNKFTIFPLVFLVPGQLFVANSPFWPMFRLFGSKVSILVVPFLIGYRFKFVSDMSADILKRLANATGWLAWLSLGLTIDAFLWKNLWFEVLAIIVLLLAYGMVLYHYHRVDKRASAKQVEQAVDGIRILAVKPNTPASKMNLQTGDLILEVNGQAVRNEEQLYRALQSSPAFCHLKIKNRNGQLELKDAAIYEGAPHEIGIVTFPKEKTGATK
ncbi:PDZ domain-containing protein [Fructilactobacillus cliffordii]|uniref:PDZ domain-containing protein n=1 Tax=Fructilactobacillus cliffordii TaxID=2940299 RepID=A0A9Q9E2E6_9LACO|nr:PDZ domain-containing protein [Fructilactobacillus cliffordii]USS88687.1 PDZ domain-containing protein [Fructilactobacillus cliffordii]